MRTVFPRDEEELEFSKVEFEVMSRCPSRDVCRHIEMSFMACRWSSG